MKLERASHQDTELWLGFSEHSREPGTVKDQIVLALENTARALISVTKIY